MTEKEHRFICEGTKESPHPVVDVILVARFGTAPDVPDCEVCGRKMPKLFAPVSWNWSPKQGRD